MDEPKLQSTWHLMGDEGRSAFAKYRDVVLGGRGFGYLVKYELAMLLANACPGALGMGLRRLLYRGLLRRVGRGTVFGQCVTLRSPRRIAIGARVLVDNNVSLDGRSEEDVSIEIGDDTILSRNAILACKGGSIRLGRRVGVGPNCTFHVYTGNRIVVGDNVLIAPHCYFAGAAGHKTERTDIPIIDQAPDLRGGIVVEDNAWIGAGAIIVDGVTIGRDSIVTAGSVVSMSVPAYAIVKGSPAKVVHDRRKLEEKVRAAEEAAE
jgi:acetyltransferase-like isoleucine patch superfamily enzyme